MGKQLRRNRYGPDFGFLLGRQGARSERLREQSGSRPLFPAYRWSEGI